MVLNGDVSLQQDAQQLEAQHVDYRPSTGDLSASGSVHYTDQGTTLHSESIDVNINSKALQTGPAEFSFRLDQNTLLANQPQQGRGEAAQIIRTEAGVVAFEDVDYTHCPPGETGWELSASSMELDPNAAEGTAKHVSISFKGVPFIYVPWFRFPIGNARKSGLLPPVIARSEIRGVEISVPWYWNIAPQADATITPHNMTRRGLQIQSEWRYLNNIGHWQLDNEFLENDIQTNTRRTFTQLRHSGTPFPGWRSSIDASRVSDANYFNDFGGSFELSSLTHLEQRVDLSHASNNLDSRHQFRIQVQRFQTINETIATSSRPYQRLPQITFDTTMALPAGLSLELDSELVNFERQDSITGERLNVQPRISLPLEAPYGFLTPSLSSWHTYYSLEGTDNNPNTISRNVPVFSLDTGLLFDRTTPGGVQTLEPRLFYLYVPFEDQSDIPVFDSGTFDFSLAQLFRENRFSGADRVNDANQLTLALTTRFQENSGREWAHATIGQIIFFDDRRVALSGNSVETTERSNLVVDLGASLGDAWYASAIWQGESERQSTRQLTTRLRYTSNGNSLSLGRRFRALALDQVDLSFNVALSDSWRASGSWNYSLDDKRSIQTWLALEYESCCWAFRTAARRHLINDIDGDGEEDNDTTLYFELVMKGLGSVGDSVGSRLERDILNYSDRLY